MNYINCLKDDYQYYLNHYLIESTVIFSFYDSQKFLISNLFFLFYYFYHLNFIYYF